MNENEFYLPYSFDFKRDELTNEVLNSRKSVTWSAVPDAPEGVYVRMRL